MIIPKTAVPRSATPRNPSGTTTPGRKSAAAKTAEVLAELEADAAKKERAAPQGATPDQPSEMAARTEVPTDEAPVLVPAMKKKELIESAVARSGIKKRDAKPAIEAALALLGEALSEGRELNIVPLGKVKVTRMKHTEGAQIINARVRQPEDAKFPPINPLAHAAE